MGTFANFSTEERLGLGVAVVLHIGVAAALVVRGTEIPDYTPPERIDVSLATDISLESTAPDPSAEPAASFAPVVAELPQAETTPPVSQPVRQPVEAVRTPPPPTPRTISRPAPAPTPSARATARPTPTPTPSARATSRPAPTPTPVATRSQAATGSRLDSNFLEGRSDSVGTAGSPAATFGPTEQAALSSAITRQLKPHWTSPSGVDVDLLVTVLAWELNEDGTLRGRPRVVSQSGINDSNRPQAALHAERAIRAVQLAAPFNLPDQYYDRWRRIREWRFDRRL